MQKPEFVSCKVSSSKTWTVTFTPHGWAQITISPEVGTVAVVSDWLEGQHVWSINCLGDQDLFHFIAHRHDTSYLCEKLFGRMKRHVDFEASAKKMKTAILRRRRRSGITKTEAQLAWSEVCSWCEGRVKDDYEFLYNEEINEIVDDDLVCMLVTYEDHHHALMRDVILPTLLRSMRENP